MEHSVKLSSLPGNIAFPERLHDRIKFDPVRGQLSYRGFMTKCTYDELNTLKRVRGSDFEAVDVSSLMADPNSGRVR